MIIFDRGAPDGIVDLSAGPLLLLLLLLLRWRGDC